MNTDKLRFEITVTPALATARASRNERRFAHGTVPPPLSEHQLADMDAQIVINAAGDTPVEPPPVALDVDSVFADNPGRELADLVDRSHFHLAAHEPTPLFQLDQILKDFDPPTS